MPRIRKPPPRLIMGHLVQRFREGRISVADFEQLQDWLDSDPEVPQGMWYKRFPKFTLAGEGEMAKRERNPMIRWSLVVRIYSAALVLLLVLGTVWGECAACPLIAPQKHGCCGKHSGNCQMPSPKQERRQTCPNVLLAPVSHHNAQIDLAQTLAPAPVAVRMETPAISFAPVPAVPAKLNTGPPDLYLLNSTLLV